MTRLAAPASRRAVAGHSLLLIAAEAATRATSFLAVAYLSRTLSADGMGAVEFGVAVFGIVLVIGTGGVDVLITPAAARRPDDVPELAGRALVLSWTQLAVAIAVLAAATAWLDVSVALRTSALCFAAAALLVPAAMRFAFVAGERAWMSGATNVLGSLVFLGLCLVAVRTPADAGAVGLAWIAATAARVAAAYLLFRRRHGRIVFATDGWLAWFRRAATVGLGSIAASLMINADVVVLGMLRAPDEVAAYGLATKVPLFLSSLAVLVYTALFPTLVRAVADGDAARLRRIATEAVGLAFGLAIPGAVALGLAADPLVTLLFSDRFRAAAPVLALLAWRVPLAAAGGVFQGVVWATSPERQARIGVAVCLATLAPLPFAAVLIGPLGVAAGIVLGHLLSFGSFARAAGVSGVLRGRTLLESAAGAVVTALLLSAARPVGGVAAVALMLAAWAAGSACALAPELRRRFRA